MLEMPDSPNPRHYHPYLQDHLPRCDLLLFHVPPRGRLVIDAPRPTVESFRALGYAGTWRQLSEYKDGNPEQEPSPEDHISVRSNSSSKSDRLAGLAFLRTQCGMCGWHSIAV
jgi:hypothetical protein